MGLRIIRPVRPRSPDEVQRAALIAEGARRWSAARGDMSEDMIALFSAKIEAMKSGPMTLESIGKLVAGVSRTIRSEDKTGRKAGADSDPLDACGAVDIASLLELL